MIEKIMCSLGRHDHKAVHRNYDTVKTTYIDTGRVKYHQVHLLKCRYCGKRKFETDYTGYNKHPGITKVRDLWIDEGRVHPDLLTRKKEPPTTNTKPNTTFNAKVEQLLIKALSTDSISEARSCLDMARKHHRKSNVH